MAHKLPFALPSGDSDYIPKDPYALQHVKVDDAICILKSKGLKTDLKLAFLLIPIHPICLTKDTMELNGEHHHPNTESVLHDIQRSDKANYLEVNEH